MNSTSQLDFHPDAESLNAFVERVLPERERGQVLAHLAECGRCRQVVYLAQEAARELETTGAASYAGQATAVRPSGNRTATWFSGWHPAWAAAAALAVIVGVAVVVQVRHAGLEPKSASTAGQEIAKVAPGPEMQAGGGPSGGRVAEPTSVSVGGGKQSDRKSLSASVPTTPRAPSVEAAPSAAPMVLNNANEVAPYEPNGALLKQRAVLHGSAMQAPNVHGPAVQTQQTWSSSQQEVPVPQAPSAAASGSYRSASANPAQAQTAGVVELTQDRSAPPLIEENRPQGRQELPEPGLKTQPAGAAGIALKTTLFKLPSGLAVQSIAKWQLRVLTADVAGALFVSADAGINWEAVTPRWTGRAVLVRFRTVPAAKTPAPVGQAVGGPVSGANGLSRSAVGGKLIPAGVFEMVTDSGQVWVSADGAEWTAK